MLGSVFDWLADFSSSPWFYLVIFGVALLDSVVPAVPSETSVIIGGVSAGLGDLSLPLVIVCGAVGAICGDNLAYTIGSRASGLVQRLYARTERRRKHLEWTERQLRIRGGMLLITARFVPGGRTLVTLSSGVTHQPRRRFVFFIAIAGAIWATYAALLGYIGGKAFEDDHTIAFLFAFGLAIVMTVLIEVVRWWLGRRKAAREALQSP